MLKAISTLLSMMARVFQIALLSGTVVATMATMAAAQTHSTARSSQQASLQNETKPPVASSPSSVAAPLADFRLKSAPHPCREGASRDQQAASVEPHLSGLTLVGGLFPSSNVAAQAGALDPIQFAWAALYGTAMMGREQAPKIDAGVSELRMGSCSP